MRAKAADGAPQRLEACYHLALLRGRVYRQLVSPLARALDGAGYLPHLLAHIAYSRSAQFLADGQLRPGAYVKRAVESRELGDPAFMPPQGLNFERALAWALRGGEAETDVETPPGASLPAASLPEAQPPAGNVQTPLGPRSPAEIWQAALERLRRTLNKGVFDTWLRPAVLLGYAPEPATFSLGVPHVYVCDFIEKRLLGKWVGSA